MFFCLETSINKLEITLNNILEIISVIEKTQFSHIQDICKIILNEDNLNIDLCNRFYPLLAECLLKFPEDCLETFLHEKTIQVLISDKNCFFYLNIKKQELIITHFYFCKLLNFMFVNIYVLFF